jgi:hypothetical protein
LPETIWNRFDASKHFTQFVGLNAQNHRLQGYSEAGLQCRQGRTMSKEFGILRQHGRRYRIRPFLSAATADRRQAVSIRYPAPAESPEGIF